MRKRFFNNLGMTYIELLVALALLSIIVVSFTPMLMYSYDNLYKAGERVENVYNSQQELEEGLAVRSSTKMGTVPMTFVMNAEKLFENMNVTGRKVVSSLQDRFETIFYGVRARIDFLSPDVVYDDSTSHEVVLQTTGLKYNKVTYIYNYSGKLEDLSQNEIVFAVYLPNKATGNLGTTTDELVYQTASAIDTSLVSFDSVKGRIKFTISGTDFTLSPVKILVYYKNERGILKTLSRYLTIEPPTIIMAGTSAVYDYYTTAGIEEKDASVNGEAQSSQFEFKLEGRTMRTSNSPYLTKYFGSPKNTGSIIRNVTWVSNDEAAGIAPYYVMVGTNGAIYRMYNYTSHNSDIFKLSIGETTDGLKSIDNTYNTTEGVSIYSSLWSGDKSHVFDFSSWDRSMNYGLDEEGGNDNCWLTASQRTLPDGTKIKVGPFEITLKGDTRVNNNTGDEKYNLFGMRAKFSYYLNGYRVGFSYTYQAARNMSYIITEHGSPLRAFGFLKSESDYKGFTEIWYPSGTYSVISRNKSVSDLNTIVVFDGTTGGGPDGGRHNETAFASIRYTNLGSYNPNNTSTVDYTLVNFMRTDGSATDDREQARQITGGYDSLHGRESEINITDAIYIPSAGSVAGSMFYIGNVHAYMNIMQKDNINPEANVASTIYNRAKNKDWDPGEYAPHGALTDYIVYGNAEGTGTTVHKYSSGTVGEVYVNKSFLGTETGVERSNTNGVDAATKQAKMQEGTGYMPTGDNRRHFFVARDTNQWKGMFMSDVLFTMGYSSNREKVYTNITYDGNREYYRSYEHLYFQSHYGIGGVDENGSPNKIATRATVGSATNRNIYNNDYYNVWFPGEMYNLSKVASKDGVTVAVGYTVAGSAYQWINNAQTTNTSTALGGIYNDGVLAAMVEGKQSEFTNLLYFKDNKSFNSTYLTSGWPNSDYKNAFGTYGTHERDSVQFTAVDINVENDSKTENATSQTRRYYAYYGDNKGRLFRSLVATSTVSVQGAGSGEDITTTEDINLVSFISDNTYAGTVAAPSTMEEIKLGTTPLSEYFSQIVTVDAHDDIIVVSGSPKTATTKNCVVVGVMDGSGSWTWKVVYLGGFQGFPLYASKIVGGYYYSAGQNWAGACNLETLKEVKTGTVLPPKENKSETKDAFIYVGVADQIYAMDGRETN